MSPDVVEGFAGPGGWSTGLAAAGYGGVVLGIEQDADACATARAAGHARLRGDVAKVDPAQFTGADGLIMSPPCQAWSAAGTRQGELDRDSVYARMSAFARGRAPQAVDWRDERAALTAEPMRYAAVLRPRWIACEQVPPVLPLWQHMAALLREIGYRTWTGVLSAERYGVPQTRRRAILIARSDGPAAIPPAPTHQPYRATSADETPDLFGDLLPPPVSMADALGWGLPDRRAWTVTAGGTAAGGAEVFGNARNRKQLRDVVICTGNQSRIGRGKKRLFTRAVEAPAPTLTSNVNSWVASRPATTSGGDQRTGRSGHKDRDLGEAQFAEGSVRVSAPEAGVLQGFSPDYPWQGTKSAQYRQIGDAVPPPLARAILAPLVAGADTGEVVV